MNIREAVRTVVIVFGLSVLVAAGGCGSNHDTHEGHDHSHEQPHGDSHDHHDDEEMHHDDHDGHDEEASGHGHDHDEHEEGGGAEYDATKGIALRDEAKKMIGLETDVVSVQKMSERITTTAQVFSTGDNSTWVSALVPSERATHLIPGQTVEVILGATSQRFEGVLRRIDRQAAAAVGQAEAIIQVDVMQETIGTFLQVAFNGSERDVLAMPLTALIESATGVFAYVNSDGRYLKTSVQTGIRDGNKVEILDGLRSGDRIVSEGAEDLWLIELRFTKGGGHSH